MHQIFEEINGNLIRCIRSAFYKAYSGYIFQLWWTCYISLLCTENNSNHLIFDWVIHKIKRGRFLLRHSILLTYANRHLVNIAQTQKLSCVAGAEFCGQSRQNWLPWQRHFRDRKTNSGSFIYSYKPVLTTLQMWRTDSQLITAHWKPTATAISKYS